MRKEGRARLLDSTWLKKAGVAVRIVIRSTRRTFAAQFESGVRPKRGLFVHSLKASTFLVLVTGVCFDVSAADTWAVHVRSACSSDPVGERVAVKVREGLSRSSSMTSVANHSDSVIKMSIICTDPDKNWLGSFSNYSYAITAKNAGGYYDYQNTHGVGSCGTKRVDECADALVADIDAAIRDVVSRVKDGTFKYKTR